NLDSSLDRNRTALLYELCRSACGLPNILVTTTTESFSPRKRRAEDSSSSDSGVEVARKRVKMSLHIDSVDDSTFPVVSAHSFDELVSKFRTKFGDVDDTELPSIEQLSGLQSKLDEGICPYCDFAVFTVAPRDRLRRLKAQGWSLNQEGEAQRIGSLRIPTFAEWVSSFDLFTNSLLMLSVASSADMKKYKSVVSGLHETYSEFWLQIYSADDFMRS
ncbi:hypothetical protein FOL47_005038, partial [Perkinsus chesapeaki]